MRIAHFRLLKHPSERHHHLSARQLRQKTIETPLKLCGTQVGLLEIPEAKDQTGGMSNRLSCFRRCQEVQSEMQMVYHGITEPGLREAFDP